MIDYPSTCHQRKIREEKEIEYKDNIFWQDIEFTKDNADVRIIPAKEAEKLIVEYEWLGNMPSAVYFATGLFFNNILTCVETFIKNRAGGLYTLYKHKAVCLCRGCCSYFAPPWASSYLISKSLKLLQEYHNGEPLYIIAYSDWDAGEIGIVYQASNWYYLGHDYKYEWRDTDDNRWDIATHRNKARARDPEWKSKKKLNPKIVQMIKQELIDSGWTIRKIMRGRYATVIGYRCKEKDEMIHILETHKKSYPKREIE